jgi:hypothetical protein
MKRIVFLLSALALLTWGCASQPTANTSPASSPAKSGSTTAAKPTKANAKKAPTSNPVPTDWIAMSDDVRGYEFEVPQGTQHQSQTVEGVDVYMASVPAPYEVGVMVVAFKDKSLSKDDLIKQTESILKGLDEKDIKIEPAKELSDDYSVATFTSIGKDGKPGKGKILVGTDVTDNYIMLVGGDADKFDANEKAIDEIWGSFGMYSGGFSGNS